MFSSNCRRLFKGGPSDQDPLIFRVYTSQNQSGSLYIVVSLGHFQVGSYRYRSLIEGLYTLYFLIEALYTPPVVSFK